MQEHINHFPNLVPRLLSCSSSGAREGLGNEVVIFSAVVLFLYVSSTRAWYHDPRNKPEDDYCRGFVAKELRKMSDEERRNKGTGKFKSASAA